MKHSMELQRFAQGAAPGEGTAAAAGQQTAAALGENAESGAQTGETVQAAAAQTGQGKTPLPQGNPSEEAGQTARAQAFEKLITGEYREEFAQRVQNILSRRLARAHEAEQELSHMKQTKQQQETDHRSALRTEIVREVRQAREAYPQMDLDAELQNPQLRRLLHAGVTLCTAYETIHHDEILRGAMGYTAKTVAEKLAQSSTFASRVPENGSGLAGAADTRPDVAHLTRDQRRALIARARAGERIEL